jgi:hypothetical protein
MAEAKALFERAASALRQKGYSTEVRSFRDPPAIYLTISSAQDELVAIKYQADDYEGDTDYVSCYYGSCRGLPRGKVKYLDFNQTVSFDRLVASLLASAKTASRSSKR